MRRKRASFLGRCARWLGRIGIPFAVAGPLLAHFELVAPATGFGIFALGGLAAVVALVVGLLALLLGPAGARAATGGAILPALVLVVAVYVANGAGLGAPRINDITTDVANPPQFVRAATLPENAGRDLSYPGAAFARLQREGYGEIEGLALPLPPEQGYARVVAAAKRMPGWTVTREDPAAYAVEGYEATRLFRFTDDFVIEVRPDASGSIVQMRSRSRTGRGDLGANARRIAAFLDAVRNAP